MADVPVRIFRSERVRSGTSPSIPSYSEDEEPIVYNPPGSGGGNAGIGIFLNAKVIGGVKRFIEASDVLVIPQYWEYNIHGVSLDVDGLIINDGEINVE